MPKDPKYPEVEFDFEADLHIDKHNLDEALVNQSTKMMRYNKAHAQAMFDRDRAKQNLDQCKARLDSEIRAELNAMKDEAGKPVKYTEAVVDGRVKTHPDYMEALDRLNKAEYKVNVLFGGVMAMNANRPLLADLVRLYLDGYWSSGRTNVAQQGPKATQADTEAAVMRSQEEMVAPAGWGQPKPGETAWPLKQAEQAEQRSGPTPISRPMPAAPPIQKRKVDK